MVTVAIPGELSLSLHSHLHVNLATFLSNRSLTQMSLYHFNAFRSYHTKSLKPCRAAAKMHSGTLRVSEVTTAHTQ